MSPWGLDHIFTLLVAGARRVVSEGSRVWPLDGSPTSLLIVRTLGLSLPLSLHNDEYREDSRGFQHTARFVTHRCR
jgi:hypothetical protein